MRQDYLLEIEDLRVAFDSEAGQVTAVDGVSFGVVAGRTLGVVGESGCGKSVTSLSVMRLLPKPSGNIIGGRILFRSEGEVIDIVSLSSSQVQTIRGKKIAMIFQEPMTALNPVHTVGRQLAETFEIHFPEYSKQDVERECVSILEKVGMPSAAQRLREFPHQLSGGMRQRVMIAIALICRPDILIADEPTTALDVTVQAQILELMKSLQKEMGMAIIFITHDLGVVAEMCDDVVVMYAGKIAEKARVEDLFARPSHPYTRGLIGAIPSLKTKRKSILPTVEGMVPSLSEMPVGCRFSNRCSQVTDKCVVQPTEIEVEPGHVVSCHYALPFGKVDDGN